MRSALRRQTPKTPQYGATYVVAAALVRTDSDLAKFGATRPLIATALDADGCASLRDYMTSVLSRPT